MREITYSNGVYSFMLLQNEAAPKGWKCVNNIAYTNDSWLVKQFYLQCDIAAYNKLSEVFNTHQLSCQYVWKSNIKPNGLMPEQVVAVEFAKNKPFTLIADKAGSGKTISAIAIANENKHKKILVVCTATIKGKWLRELQHWLLDKTLSINILSVKNPQPADINIINYDLITREEIMLPILAQGLDYVIFDESHYLKGDTSMRTLAAYGISVAEYKLKQAFSKFIKEPKRTDWYVDGLQVHYNKYSKIKNINIASKAKQVVCLTGTPIVKDTLDLLPMLKALAPNAVPEARTYTDFFNRYIESVDLPFGTKIIGSKNLDRLFWHLRSTIMICREQRHTSIPVMEILPVELTDKVTLAKEAESLEIIKRITLKQAYKNMGVLPNEDLQALPQYRQKAAKVKLDACVEHIESLVEQNEKVVVFAYHTETVEYLQKALNKYKPVVIYGKTPVEKRDGIAKQFQNDPETMVFVGNIQAAGEGIDLFAARYVVFVETNWLYKDIEQCIARCNRKGQTRQVIAQFITILNSVDEYVLSTALQRRKNSLV
jgi:SWI/SNF-related matrix-associated actin-dependent regulator of chromatin subfamily A-like protein 1